MSTSRTGPSRADQAIVCRLALLKPIGKGTSLLISANGDGRTAMAEYKYRAFISYSHRDEKWADWLHKALESYRPPKNLVGTQTSFGSVPKRFSPVFRDREELPSATSLGEVLNRALQDSAVQIVICSPNAAQSHWVNEEILSFKRLGREDRIFCLIVDGEPNVSGTARRDEECFPEALRFRIGDDNELTEQPTEPIAADARPGKDGKANAKLKLLSGMLGVGFDALKQREQQRRQRRLIAVTSAAVIGMVITTSLATLAFLGRAEAERQRQRAEQEAETAQETTDFLVGLFAVSDPGEARGNTITAREILDEGARQVRRELDGQPAVQARLMDTMGSVYQSLGLYEQAEDLLADALEKNRGLYGGEHEMVAKSMAHLAEVLSLRAEFDAAEPLYRDALSTQRKLLGDSAPEVANTLEGFADLISQQGQYEAAEILLRECLEIRRAVSGDDDLTVAKAIEDLGMNLFDQARYDEAEQLLLDSIDMRREILHDEPHPDLADAINNLGLLYLTVGDYEKAEANFREALTMNRVLYGDQHPMVAVTLNNLAFVMHDKGDYADAEPLFIEVLSIRREMLGAEHPEVAAGLINLAFVQYDKGDRSAALLTARDSLSMYQRLFPGDHPSVAGQLVNLGDWLTEAGDFEAAEPMLDEALGMNRRLLGDEHPDVGRCLVALAELYTQTERSGEAGLMASQARKIFTATLPEGHWRTAWAGSIEGAALTNMQRYLQAEERLLESYGMLREHPAVRDVHVKNVLENLIELYDKWGRPEQASEYKTDIAAINSR